MRTPLFGSPLLFLTLALLLAAPAAGQTYVDADATGAGDGSSWRDAYPTLQEALANTTGGEIWVAEGTYYPDDGPAAPDDRTESFDVPSGVVVRGRFEGTESSPSERVLDRGVNVTTLSGEIQQDGDPSNNAYHVLEQSGGVVEAVRITGGNANASGDQGVGGGVYLTGGELRRSFVQGNRGRRGAGLYVTGAPELRRLLVNDNRATASGAIYLEDDAATLNNLTVADNTANDPDGASGLHHINSDATVTNSAFGTDTDHTVGPLPPDNVTATYEGTVLEEGSPLGGADITIHNADADTLITTTQTDASGDYQAPHTYPDDHPYEAAIIADNADHQADTAYVDAGTTDDTYTSDFDLERRVHTLTIQTDDADTGSPVDAAGAVTTGSDTLTTYDTGADGETTVGIETLNDQITVSADADTYEPNSTTEILGSEEVITTTIGLTPVPQDEPMTITVNAHEIAEDLFDGGYGPNPEDITITTPDTTITADFQNETATFTIPDTSNVDDITLSHDDTTDYLPAVSLFKTAEQSPIDLTQSTDEFDEFPREPYAQSNYGDNTDTNDRTITIPTEDLVDTYELRFIPSQTPRGNSTADDYVPHLNQGRSKRFKNRTVGDTTYTQDKLFIVEHNENNWMDKASQAYSDVRDTLPFPTSQPDTISYDSLLTIRAERNYMNVTDIEEGSNGNAIFDGPRFIEESFAKASASTTQGTFTSEAYSSFNGYEDTAGDEDINDTIFGPDGNFLKDEAAFPLRIQYSSFSDNDNF